VQGCQGDQSVSAAPLVLRCEHCAPHRSAAAPPLPLLTQLLLDRLEPGARCFARLLVPGVAVRHLLVFAGAGRPVVPSGRLAARRPRPRRPSRRRGCIDAWRNASAHGPTRPPRGHIGCLAPSLQQPAHLRGPAGARSPPKTSESDAEAAAPTDRHKQFDFELLVTPVQCNKQHARDRSPSGQGHKTDALQQAPVQLLTSGLYESPAPWRPPAWPTRHAGAAHSAATGTSRCVVQQWAAGSPTTAQHASLLGAHRVS
jgi:hypothetical protein